MHFWIDKRSNDLFGSRGFYPPRRSGSMVTVSSQTLPMMRRKGSYRLRRPSRYKTSWSSGMGGSGSGGGSGAGGQNIPPNPHGSPNSLMQAAVARLDLPRPHLVYIGSTGSTGRIRPQPQIPPPPLPTVPPQNQSSRPPRPRRLLDPSVPVRLPPSTSSSSSGPPSSATPPAMPFQPSAAPVPLANLAQEPMTTTSTRQYAANRPRLRHHNRGRKQACLRRPLGCEVACAGACLPGWGALRTLAGYTLGSAACYGCLLLINAYLDFVYNKEAMRNLLVLILITAGLFAITRICRMRLVIRLFDPDGLKIQYRAGSSSPLLVSRRDGRQLCRPLRCGDVTGRMGATSYVPTSRSGGVDTDGGEADIEDDPDIEQGQSLVPASNDVPTGATDDDDDDGVGIGVTDMAGAAASTPDPDAASTSVGTPPPPPYATVVGGGSGSSSPPPSYDKVVH